MKTTRLLFFVFSLLLSFGHLNAQKPTLRSTSAGFIPEQVSLDYNNISTWIQNTGTFNQDIRTNNTPGFMWPKGSNKFTIFTTGLTIGGYVNGKLRLAAASYTGGVPPRDSHFSKWDSNSLY